MPWSSVSYTGVVCDSATAPCRNHLLRRPEPDVEPRAGLDGAVQLPEAPRPRERRRGRPSQGNTVIMTGNDSKITV
jgi:hypothetical protein